MTRRKRFLLIPGALLILALPAGVWFEPTGVVRGWWAGEPFYRGRPASYWRLTFLGENALARAMM